MPKYEPELGQMCFGQPWKKYEASDLLIAAINEIYDTWEVVSRNIYQTECESPFHNTGAVFKCPAFQVEAYSWKDNEEQPYNFKWKDVEVSWYKHYRRGTSVNQELTPARIEEMLMECIKELRKMDEDNFNKIINEGSQH